MVRLEGEATLARERERALSQRNQLTVFLVLLSIAVVLVMAVYFAAQRRSNARLQQSLDARLRALTQTSHELRNPIGGVLGLSELLLKTPINAAQRSMVEAIRSAGSTIEKLAQDLLDRGRIESGRLSLSLQPASLATARREPLSAAPAAGPREGPARCNSISARICRSW
ncbi:MAG: histidine kinase dimerization/phospho-acceptor domain-containing protein [Gemmatimonadales bacterium]